MAIILIVEDDPVGAEVATVICQAAGHTTRLATNGREALQMLGEGHYDLVLMDVQMPELDGITLTQMLRTEPAFAHLPILGCTAKAGSEALTAMREAGMDAVVTKPYRNATLRDAVAEAIATGERRHAPPVASM
jgi:CheY-like chemotaxis protein